MGDLLVNAICIIFVNRLCKLQSHYVFQFILSYFSFYANDKVTYQPCADGSPNSELIKREQFEADFTSSRSCRHYFSCLKNKRVSAERHPFFYLLKTC